jgi:hypothetical protein
MTTVVISQPMLFPWSGFFELLSCADIYVHLDDVQFSRGGFTNRIQIKHVSGPKWMSIPLSGKGAFQEIRHLRPAGNDWKRQHRAMVWNSLRAAPHLNAALALFDQVYAGDHLARLLMESIEQPARLLGLDRPQKWLTSSELGFPGSHWQRVLAIVKGLGGTRYLTAHGAINYLDHEAFERAGVRVDYIDYSKTEYPQQHGAFNPYVSILDVVANMGPAARSVIEPRTMHWRAFVAARQGGG